MSVPATLAPLVVAPWSSNRSVPTSVAPLTLDLFSLGGVSGLNPGRAVSWVGVATWLVSMMCQKSELLLSNPREIISMLLHRPRPCFNRR